MDSLHEIAIAAPMSKVWDAWTTNEGLRAWWTVDSTITGDMHVFGFDGGAVQFRFRTVAEDRGTSLRWVGVAAPKMPDEWVDTEIDVSLSATADGTRMLFAHRGWRSSEGFYRMCNTTWGELVYRLRDWCEGKPRGPLFAK